MQPDFEQIYNEYSELIFRFLYYKTYNRETAEDITSGTFLRAIEKQDSFNPQKGNISSWLFAIARNLCTDYFRKNRKHLDIDDIWDLHSDDDFTVDAENKEQFNQLKQFLGQLSEVQRSVIIMRIWMEMPYKEIAEVLKKSEASLKMTFGRTIKHLREKMDDSVFMLLLFLPLFIKLRSLLLVSKKKFLMRF